MQERESAFRVLLNTGDITQVVHSMKSNIPTKRERMCAFNEKNYRQLSTRRIPSVTVVMVCIIHSWKYLSVKA